MRQVNIDPQGDVRLVATLGDSKEVAYLVNSQVLSLASKVFKTLFQGPFLEGRTRHERTQSLQDVPLPDDPPTGLRLLLDFLHFCPRPSRLDLEPLAELAVVVDKYQCVDVFKSQAEIWLGQQLNGQGVASNLAEYLGVAMAFRSPAIFHDVCIGLMLGGSEGRDSRSVPSLIRKSKLSYLVPQHTIDAIMRGKLAIHQNITHAVANALHPLLSKIGDSYSDHNDDDPCRHDDLTIANYCRLCHLHSVLPAGPSSPIQRLHKLCSVARNMLHYDAGSDFAAVDNDESTPCTACDFILSCEQQMMKIVDSMMHDVPIPCFAIARGQKIEFDDHGKCNCRCCQLDFQLNDAVNKLFHFSPGPSLLEGSAKSSIESEVGKLLREAKANAAQR